MYLIDIFTYKKDLIKISVMHASKVELVKFCVLYLIQYFILMITFQIDFMIQTGAHFVLDY